MIYEMRDSSYRNLLLHYSVHFRFGYASVSRQVGRIHTDSMRVSGVEQNNT